MFRGPRSNFSEVLRGPAPDFRADTGRLWGQKCGVRPPQKIRKSPIGDSETTIFQNVFCDHYVRFQAFSLCFTSNCTSPMPTTNSDKLGQNAPHFRPPTKNSDVWVKSCSVEGRAYALLNRAPPNYPGLGCLNIENSEF